MAERIQNDLTERERYLLASSDPMLRSEGRRMGRQRRQREARKARASVYDSLGMVRVRGSAGGTYWE